MSTRPGRLVDICEDLEKIVHRIKMPKIDRYISLNALRSRVATARPIEMDFRRGTGVQLTEKTTRNRLHENNFGERLSALPHILT